jgi:hypothetical protein
MVTRTRLSVTLYVQCLLCLKLRRTFPVQHLFVSLVGTDFMHGLKISVNVLLPSFVCETIRHSKCYALNLSIWHIEAIFVSPPVAPRVTLWYIEMLATCVALVFYVCRYVGRPPRLWYCPEIQDDFCFSKLCHVSVTWLFFPPSWMSLIDKCPLLTVAQAMR